jgi:predicted RNA-binding Zn ribbon-like protein
MIFDRYNLDGEVVTGQVFIDSYMTPGIRVAIDLVNDVVVRPAHPTGAAVKQLLSLDPPSVASYRERDGDGFTALAEKLHTTFMALDSADVDTAAAQLNDLLAMAPQETHLSKDDGQWVLHHHPKSAALVPAWTSICAEAMARLVADGHADRAGLCEAEDCRRAFIDTTKNTTRRFCSTVCQNRVKTAALRRRRSAKAPS